MSRRNVAVPPSSSPPRGPGWGTRSAWAPIALALALSSTSSAWAGDPFAAGKLIEVLAASDVIGDGTTRATVHLLALDADGDPIPSLKLKAEVSAGTVGDVIDLGAACTKCRCCRRRWPHRPA